MKVVQCWDDGVTSDMRLVEVLRKYGARATFNLNSGLHGAARGGEWEYKGTLVERMAVGELRSVYEGFTIANHSVSHLWLEQVEVEVARREVVDSRDWLQQHFEQEVLGFAYPYGTHSEAVREVVGEAGHVYGRVCESATPCFPPEDAMAFRADCHFLHEGFWAKYEAARVCGVFYFWGHSYEIVGEEMWAAFDEQVARISADVDSEWAEVYGLFV